MRANAPWDARRDRGIVTNLSLKTRLTSPNGAKSSDTASLQRIGRQAKLSIWAAESSEQSGDRTVQTKFGVIRNRGAESNAL